MSSQTSHQITWKSGEKVSQMSRFLLEHLPMYQHSIALANVTPWTESSLKSVVSSRIPCPKHDTPNTVLGERGVILPKVKWSLRPWLSCNDNKSSSTLLLANVIQERSGTYSSCFKDVLTSAIISLSNEESMVLESRDIPLRNIWYSS